MTQLTRRNLLGLAGGVAGLAACGQRSESDTGARVNMDADTRAPYDGEVAYRHGVASGDPLADRVIIWTRMTPLGPDNKPVPVSYGVFADREMQQPVAFGLTLAEPGRDFCVKVDVEGLEPDTEYFYRFIARATSGQMDSPLGRTRTAAPTGTSPQLKFAVISCSNYPFGLFNVYREIAKRDDLDAVIHLGDYLYEYGVDGYGGETGQALGRTHDPVIETVTLEDYRTRHAQYKSDPDLQAAHAAAPWLCTWDDHESTNNSYRSGAENHNPQENEGDWSDRKQAAVQAYLEWMPVRDPEPGRAREAIYRRFDFGDTATIFCLESRLTGRSDEISWFAELGGLEPARIPMAAARTMTRVQADERTMLGAAQEDWLAGGLAASAGRGTSWQVLANQVIMARVRPPNFTRTLSEDQIAAVENGYVRQLIPFSQLALPWNLDAWDGFPAARERLYKAAAEAGANLVTLTGDTHTAWANNLHDAGG
ncbi:MAG: alkaline phosphatase, partial [Alphaproteobacteria bacterium]|nr:alkaline phosphatase [Alphaproteobacteria bacterium]